jgi:Glycosyl hydrolase family 26
MNRRAVAVLTAAFLLILATPAGLAQSTQPSAPPVNPQASPEARSLLRYLDSISGKYTITGQHNFPNSISPWTDRTYDLTGKYPGLFGQDFGFSGGEDMYRQLFSRLVDHDGLHNLIWVWDAAAPGFGPNAAGQYGDFFPGLVYVDALALDAPDLNSRFRSDTFLSLMSVGKVIGLRLTGKIPDPALFAQQTGWAWFVLSPQTAGGTAETPDQVEALRKLYSDSRVLSRADTR